MRRKHFAGVLLLVGAMKLSTVGCSTDKKDEKEKEPELINQVSQEEVPEIEGYKLLWNDEFNGDTLDDSIWSYDPHEPGWTNNELQEYTESTDNVYVKDGNLVLKAIKTLDEKNKPYYTSGKVKTQNKKDFMYGKVVARAKVPVGKGLWPAIWMMPTDESCYGQWPKCGEIDIMEVLCNEPQTAYGTIHYGEPHAEQQSIYTLEDSTFADDFHEFSVEWEPGEMRFYIDGNLYHTVNEWFTAEEDEDDKEYPAPFNQTFFVQLNLAVGGTWPGNPDSHTDFDNAEFLIDYVRVYQKDEYDMNVKRPEKIFREPTEDGNLIYNGDFSDNEDIHDEENWYFLLFDGGEGDAALEDGELVITTQKWGNQEYSVQMVQPQLPMRRGHKYVLTFDAKADEDREMIVCVSAPTAGWVRYLEDTSLELTPEWQTYTYEFEMKKKDDNNGRLEFNMGKQFSTSTIHIKNVRIVDVTEENSETE